MPAGRRATRLALGLAVLFFAVALLQYCFVRRQVFKTAELEISSYASLIETEIAYRTRDKWDLKEYRRTSITVPNWYVVTSNGLVLDIEGLIAGLLGPVRLVDESIYGVPQTVVTEVGESWRLLGKRVEGGTVVLGIPNPEDLAVADKKLIIEITKFGGTLTDAVRLRSGKVESEVDYAVISASGELESDWGGVPLYTDPRTLRGVLDSSPSLIVAGTPYLVIAKPILNSSNAPVGKIIIPKKMDAEERTLHEQLLFDLGLAATSFVAAIALAIYLLWRDIVERPRHVSLKEALETKDEDQNIEFKPTFDFEPTLPSHKREGPFESLKAMAGFMNSEGGTLFIGVLNDGGICGIESDLKRFADSRDGFERNFVNQVAARIGPEFLPCVRHRFENEGDKLVLIVDVFASAKPAFLKHRAGPVFFVREGGQTRPLDPEQQDRYTQIHWRR